jgi:hypothetical protein
MIGESHRRVSFHVIGARNTPIGVAMTDC